MENVKYGVTSTYLYKLDDERLKWLANKVNRTTGQLNFLFQLCDGDFEKLKALEVRMKNCFVTYCPGDVEEVEKIMEMTPSKIWFELE